MTAARSRNPPTEAELAQSITNDWQAFHLLSVDQLPAVAEALNVAGPDENQTLPAFGKAKGSAVAIPR